MDMQGLIERGMLKKDAADAARAIRSRSIDRRKPSDSLFGGLYGLKGTAQEVRHSEHVGTATEIVVIKRLALDKQNAKHVTPLSI
jgi:hypothetical protein